MQIEVLASSSKANSYVIRGENETLLLEAGLPIKELKQKLGFDLPDACLISHSHSDHSKAVKELIRLGVDVHLSEGTAKALDISGHRVKIFDKKHEHSYYQVTMGQFIVNAFPVQHDCPEPDPLGYIIYDRESKKRILFATDTFYIRYQIPGINVAMLECNYAKDILDGNELNHVLRDRIVQSHFELENVKDFFRANDLSKLEHVLLLHLSNDNSDEVRFVKEIAEVTNVNVQVAKPGLKIKI